jgi:cell division protein FtsB
MAQDFAAAFNVGDDDRRIHVVDGQGVALAAIQGLTQELRALQAENAALAARVADLEGQREASQSMGRNARHRVHAVPLHR